MNIDKEKSLLALSALWVLASIPISENLYDEMQQSGLFMRVFALVIVVAPVWLFYGWKWLTNGAQFKKLHVSGISCAAIILGVFLASEYYWDDIAYIPIVAALVFGALAFIDIRYAGNLKETSIRSRSQLPIGRIAPEKLAKLETMNAKTTPLLRTTESLANDLLVYLRRVGGQSPMPGIIQPEADAAKAAYGLVHGAYFSTVPEKRLENHLMVLSIYQSNMLTNLTALMIPKLPGRPPLRSEKLQDEAFRGPVRELMRIEEESAKSVQENIANKIKYKFLPHYRNLRPYIGPNSTDEELGEIFEQKFGELYEKARIQVINLFSEK